MKEEGGGCAAAVPQIALEPEANLTVGWSGVVG
jgi:hypothetical protein